MVIIVMGKHVLVIIVVGAQVVVGYDGWLWVHRKDCGSAVDAVPASCYLEMHNFRS